MIEKQCLHLRPISSSRHGLRHSVYNACAKNNIITLVQYSLVIFFEVLGTFSNLSGSNMLWYINVLYHIYMILILREIRNYTVSISWYLFSAIFGFLDLQDECLFLSRIASWREQFTLSNNQCREKFGEEHLFFYARSDW